MICIQHVPLDALKFNGLTADFDGSFRTAERRSRLKIHAACLPETHCGMLKLGRRTANVDGTLNNHFSTTEHLSGLGIHTECAR